MNIISGKIDKAQKVVIYGPEGIGKSTMASHFPNPVFIDTEGSTNNMDIRRTEKPSSWPMLLDQVTYFKKNPGVAGTLVIDTADWAEQLCTDYICAKSKKSGIEDFGYGKGYVYLQEEFGRLLNLLTDLINIGIHVVITAHATMRKFEQPDEMGAYDRWELKLSKKTAPLLKEWSDMLLFANYKTYVINVDDQGAKDGKNKAQGGKRTMYTTHHVCWDAKNRHGLPDELPFDYSSIAHIFNKKTLAAVTNPDSAKEVSTVRPVDPEPAPKSPVTPPVVELPQDKSVAPVTAGKAEETPKETNPNIPKALLDLMNANNVHEWDIQMVVGYKGYYPEDTPIEKYDPDFINGCLIGAWDGVLKAIRGMKEKEEIPFK